MFLIVGLGNPGEKYKNTRHNLGRMVVEHFPVDFSRDSMTNAMLATTTVAGVSAELMLPDTYMNKSGESVRHFVPRRVKPSELIVVHDELALPFCDIKISYGKSAAGHNGVESIIDQLGTRDFIRVRCGVAPTGMIARFFQGPNADFVLKNFSKGESAKLAGVIKSAREAVEMIIRDGREKAMNKFN